VKRLYWPDGVVTVRSLTARLTLGIVLLILLSVGLMAGLAVWRSAAAFRERALVTNHTVALGVSYAVEQSVADAVAIMREAAERPKLRQEITSGNWPEARTVLENITRHFRQFDYVFAQDSQGIIRARVPHAETVGEDFSSRDFFREAMQTRQPYLSGVRRHRTRHTDLVFHLALSLDARPVEQVGPHYSWKVWGRDQAGMFAP
jgi:sensor histidine kinase regulating citrate/malate metabolism